MSCLFQCGCPEAAPDGEITESNFPHEESEYLRLTESIPLLPKDSAMITYEADSSHYTLLGNIGSGLDNVTTISITRHLPTGQMLAVRRTNIENLPNDFLASIQKEILITRQLKHENLLPFFCSFVFDKEVWAVMPLMTYGSTRDIMYNWFKAGLPELAISFILKDVVSALDYIHRSGYIHRSIKASHVLISSSGRALLSGLRYSCNVINQGKWQNALHSFPADTIGNLNWLSPELLEQSLVGYSSKSDIYSLGITACELANGIVPFAEMPPTQMLLEKLQGYHPRPLDCRTFEDDEEDSETDLGDRLKRSIYHLKQFSDAFHVFTELCLHRDALRRPNAAQLLRHVFLKHTRKSNINLHNILAVVVPVSEHCVLSKEGKDEKELQEKFKELAVGEDWDF